jgi:CheY-like chemotaxis protein
LRLPEGEGEGDMPTVLVIDDDPKVREVCREMLRRDGFSVREAADGQEGLAAYLIEPADVVLCDLLMPERGGLGTINELLRAFPHARVVAMSGGGTSLPGDELAVAGALGAAATIAKPFTRAELAAAVRAALPGEPSD